jgi:spore maturation protein CgeB
MKVLYIGQYTKGTTSRMRGETIKDILNSQVFEVIDTHIPFFKTSKIWRTLGFRYKLGPLVQQINKYIIHQLKEQHYDLIWVDKAVFIRPETTTLLRSKAVKLVHFTPDPAFTFHQSKLFFKSLAHYDYLITTKSYELEHYYKYIKSEKVLYATQGFDAQLHQPSAKSFSEKDGFVFIGHYEKERAAVLQQLLENDVQISLAGIKWDRFAKKHEHNPNLNYLGNGVYGEDYVKTLQKAKIAWGAISKWVPELHTTRTFEIPACGTALLTEANKETQSFFKEDEVIFYNSDVELVEKVLYYMTHDKALEQITIKGCAKVKEAGYDYTSIISKILKEILN